MWKSPDSFAVFGGGHAVAVDEEAMEGLSALEATFFCHCFDGVVAFCLEKHHGVVEPEMVDVVGEARSLERALLFYNTPLERIPWRSGVGY